MDVSSGSPRAHALRSRQSPHRRTTSGFTLIELLVMVVIVGIFAAIAMPSFSGMLHRMNVRSAADEFYDLLQYTRAEAVTRGTTVNISAAVGTTSLIVKTVTSNTTLRQIGANGLQPGVTINSATNSVDFSATGTASTTACFQILYPADTSVPSQYISLLSSGRITAPSATAPSGC